MNAKKQVETLEDVLTEIHLLRRKVDELEEQKKKMELLNKQAFESLLHVEQRLHDYEQYTKVERVQHV